MKLCVLFLIISVAVPSSVAETRKIIAARSSFNTTTYFYLGGRDEILWCVSVSYGVTLTTKIGGGRCFRFSFLIYFLILLGDDPKRAENLRTKFG